MTSKEPNKLKEDVPGESGRAGSDGEEEARTRRRKTRMSYGCVTVAWVWGVGIHPVFMGIDLVGAPFGLYRIHSFDGYLFFSFLFFSFIYFFFFFFDIDGWLPIISYKCVSNTSTDLIFKVLCSHLLDLRVGGEKGQKESGNYML